MALELLAPAGDLEKADYALAYGADAIYMGLPGFSLRAYAEGLADGLADGPTESPDKQEGNTAPGALWPRLLETLNSHKLPDREPRRLYLAVNRYFQPRDLDRLEKRLELLAEETASYGQEGKLPWDAFIVADPGAARVLKRHFPGVPLHLSTQANCSNGESARFWQDQGFSRIVLARECSLEDIARIRLQVPEVQLEAFVHGAMCVAYSGRCLVSAWTTGRSANQGACTQTCRWKFRVVEEEKRPGETFPVEEYQDEHGGYTALFSSRDLNMINHLADLESAGVDSLKIEGRMKGVAYLSVVVQAYRARLEALAGHLDPERAQVLADYVHKVSHREYSTGFYYDNQPMNSPNLREYERSHIFCAQTGPAQPQDGKWLVPLVVKNNLRRGEELELYQPHLETPLQIRDPRFLDAKGNELDVLHHGQAAFLVLDQSIPNHSLVLRPLQGQEN